MKRDLADGLLPPSFTIFCITELEEDALVAGATFFLGLPTKQNANPTPAPTKTTAPAAEPIMIPRFEPDESVSLTGVVCGGAGFVVAGNGVVVGVGVVAFCVDMVVDFFVVAAAVEAAVGAAAVVAGTINSTFTCGADTLVVLPTESAESLALTTAVVILCCTAVAFMGSLSTLISVTTSAVPAAASSRLSIEKLEVTTVLMVSTVALITALGLVHTVSYSLLIITVLGV